MDDKTEALQTIEQLKKDFYEVFEKTEAGERVLEHLKEITNYHRPSHKREHHLWLQDLVAGQIIDHIYTFLELPKEEIYQLNIQ